MAEQQFVLAVCDAGEVFSIAERRFANDAAGIRQLRRLLSTLGALRVCLEPTSRYHLALLDVLSALKQVSCHLAPPLAVHHFAQACGRGAKTDPLDARNLARFVLHCAPPAYQPPPAQALRLRAITRRVAALIAQRTAELNRLHCAKRGGDPPAVKASVQRHIRQLGDEIARLEQAALAEVHGSPRLADCYAWLIAMKGIGQRSALALLGELAVLPATLSKRQWVALAGLDPQPRESGSSLNPPRHISRRGNSALRRALYMPALVISQRSGPGRAYYQDLLARGKRPLVALTALLRKLLTAIWGMFNSHTAFDPARFYHCSA